MPLMLMLCLPPRAPRRATLDAATRHARWPRLRRDEAFDIRHGYCAMPRRQRYGACTLAVKKASRKRRKRQNMRHAADMAAHERGVPQR